MLRIIVEPFVNLYAVELPQLRGQRRVDGVGRRRLISTQAGRDLPALRDARRAGEEVSERIAAS